MTFFKRDVYDKGGGGAQLSISQAIKNTLGNRDNREHI